MSDEKKLTEELEKRYGKKISWSKWCTFYADSRGHLKQDGALLCLTDVTFHVWNEDFEDSFTSLDVLYTDFVLKSEAIEFAEGKIEKVHRANPFKALTKPTVLSIELEGKKFMFFEMKGQEFRQLLSIAQAKQKYSHRVSDRNS
ncbi:MAG: hypothetical protein K6F82_00655 [Sphaerochaetaceae bacterium]|nr:hypothetical protein [Sphaerochaetaceae bacterium]